MHVLVPCVLCNDFQVCAHYPLDKHLSEKWSLSWGSKSASPFCRGVTMMVRSIGGLWEMQISTPPAHCFKCMPYRGKCHGQILFNRQDQDHLRITSTIILCLQIYLDQWSSRTVNQKFVMTNKVVSELFSQAVSDTRRLWWALRPIKISQLS